MRKLFLLFFIGIVPFLGFATTFYFTGIEDTYYANPANWSPFYPGTNIERGDIVILQSNCNFDGFDIVIQGQLFIELGENLNSSSSGMKIQESGIVKNEGEIALQYIQNNGKLINGLYAIIFTEKYYSNKAENINGLIYSQFSSPDFDEQGYASAAANDPSVVTVSLKRGFHPVSSKAKQATNAMSTITNEHALTQKKSNFFRKLFSY